MDLLPLLARWAHVGSAIVMLGGSVFVRFVLMPAAAGLPDEQHDGLRTRVMQTWKKFVMVAILLFLISGIYNTTLTIPDHSDQPLYHALLGIKFMLALVVFFFASALSGRSGGTAWVRKDASKWLAVTITIAAVVVAIAGYLKLMPAGDNALNDSSVQVSENQVITFEYTLSDAEGNVLDSSERGQPLAYIHGTGHIIPGLEKALEGKSPGDSFRIIIAPEEAYGQREESLISTVARSQFAGVENIAVGMQLDAESQDGVIRTVTVLKVGGDKLTVDANHALAGMELTYDVYLVGIRPATFEEIQHGHVHSPGASGRQ